MLHCERDEMENPHFLRRFSPFHSQYIYIYIYIHEQDLGTVLRCCFLGYSLKILPCDFFFLMGLKCIFLVR